MKTAKARKGAKNTTTPKYNVGVYLTKDELDTLDSLRTVVSAGVLLTRSDVIRHAIHSLSLKKAGAKK